MDPQELKRIFEEKKSSDAEVSAKAKAAHESALRELRENHEAAVKALKEVVLPYLKSVQSTVGAAFHFQPTVNTSNETIGATFQIAHGQQYIISTSGKFVSVKVKVPNVPMGASVDFQREVPPINSIGDLTEDNLGKLIAYAIKRSPTTR